MNQDREGLKTYEPGSKFLMESEHGPRGSAYPLQAKSNFECGGKFG